MSRTRRRAPRACVLGLLLAAAAACVSPPGVPIPPEQEADPWFAEAREAVERARTREPVEGRARNVILFVGDGMSIATVTAARILAGQLAGQPGEEHVLSFERLPWVGLVKTYNTNKQTPDSAGSMTAMMSGVKTRAGLVGTADRAKRGQCRGAAGARVMTMVELAELGGRSTGVVTTARLTHATAAATYAHSPERGWEDDSDLPEKARRHGCPDIASQLIDFPVGDGLEVALGGGRSRFLPAGVKDPEYPDRSGRRLDGRDLTREWTEQRAGSVYVFGRDALLAIDPTRVSRVLGLFEPSHMRFASERHRDRAGEPSLAEMTARAIDLLSRDPDGFLLVVESGRIDHAHHLGNARRALLETLELDQAVRVAVERTSDRDTLIVVAADHGHALTLTGFHVPRGNPILGLVRGEKDLNGLPYTVLNYANGPGSGRVGDPPRAKGGRPDLSGVDVEGVDFRQDAAVPLEAATHSGEDVAVYGRGPWAHLLSGTIEQHVIFHVIDRAAGLTRRTAP